MMVSRFSTLQICGNTYSVPSRLIGTQVVVRVHSEVIDVYVGSQKTVIFPRLVGTGKRAISYRHVIWSLLRKPGAFAQYRYRDEFFPGMLFRQAYDQLTEALGDRADKEICMCCIWPPLAAKWRWPPP